MKTKKILLIYVVLIFMSLICGFSFFNSKRESYDFKIDIYDHNKSFDNIFETINYDSLYKFKLKKVIASDIMMEESGYRFTTKKGSDYLMIFTNDGNEDANIAIRASNVKLKFSNSKRRSSYILLTDAKNTEKDLDFSSDSGIPKGIFTILELEREKIKN